jgi:putative spermidine/putrescine transport system substrate-binding protein
MAYQDQPGTAAGRRKRSVWLLIALAALACALAIASCGADDESGDEAASQSGAEITSDQVIFADYGGTTRTARTQAFLAPFSQETEVRAVSADADPAKFQLFLENESADWDLIDLDSWDVVRFRDQGALEELPDDVARADLVPEQLRDVASGGYNASVGIGYRSDKGEAPQSWADFFDTERFPGKRALPNFAYFQAESALLADGIACEDLYPMDFDRAFAKLDEIRDDILFYESFGQGVQYLAQGSVSMVLIPHGRIAVLKDQGLPVEFNWNDAFFQWTAAAVPKYAPHSDAAFALVDFMTQPEQQAQFARLTKYGPMNSAALELLDDTTKEQLPNAHLDTACEVDNEGLAKDYDEYAKRFTEWLAKN